MSRMLYEYTKGVLESVSFDPELFMKELRKAMKKLLPYELEHLRKWLVYFISKNPDLEPYVTNVLDLELAND